MHERALSPSSEKSKDPFEEGGKGTTNREEEREREERRVTWPQRCATGDGEQAAAHKEIAVRCFRREAAAEILLLLRWASPPSLAPRGSDGEDEARWRTRTGPANPICRRTRESNGASRRSGVSSNGRQKGVYERLSHEQPRLG